MEEPFKPAGESSSLRGPEIDAPSWTWGSVFRGHRWRIILTYALFNLENLLRLAQPWALGLAISYLLQESYFGLAVFAGYRPDAGFANIPLE